MNETTDRLINIIEDAASMRTAIRMVLETIETKTLPPYSSVPCFNDPYISEDIFSCLEQASGQKYDR